MPDLNFTVENAEPEPHAAAPLLVFKLRIAETRHCKRADDHSRDRPALPDPHRADPQALRARRTGTAARPVRRARALGPDAAKHALDPRQRRRSAVHRQHDRRPPRSLLVRLQCRRDQVFPCTGRRRSPALPAVQRHDLLHGSTMASCRSARSPGKKRPRSGCRCRSGKT